MSRNRDPELDELLRPFGRAEPAEANFATWQAAVLTERRKHGLVKRFLRGSNLIPLTAGLGLGLLIAVALLPLTRSNPPEENFEAAATIVQVYAKSE
jgi:hypothetical protein